MYLGGSWFTVVRSNASKDPSKGVINAAALRESYFKDAHNRGLMSGYVSSYIYHKEMMS